MSHNPANAMVMALVLGVCSVGLAGANGEDKATTPETAVVAEKAAVPGVPSNVSPAANTIVAEKTTVPGIAEEVTPQDTNVLSHEETMACGDLSNESHDFNFDLDDDDDDDDDI
jgi:hypothetical protein